MYSQGDRPGYWTVPRPPARGTVGAGRYVAAMSDPKGLLHAELREHRAGLLARVEGLDERDLRRP